MTVLEYAKSVGIEVDEILEICKFLQLKDIDDKDDKLPDEIIEFFDALLKKDGDMDSESEKEEQKGKVSSAPDIKTDPNDMYYANEKINELAGKMQDFFDALANTDLSDVELESSYRISDSKNLVKSSVDKMNAGNGIKTRYNQLKGLFANLSDEVKFLYDAYDDGYMELVDNGKGLETVVNDADALQNLADGRHSLDAEFREGIDNAIAYANQMGVSDAFSDGYFYVEEDGRRTRYKLFDEETGLVDTDAAAKLAEIYPPEIVNSYVDIYRLDAYLDTSYIEDNFVDVENNTRGTTRNDGKIKPTLAGYDATDAVINNWILSNADLFPNLSVDEIRRIVNNKVDMVVTLRNDYNDAIRRLKSGVYNSDKVDETAFDNDYNAIMRYYYYMLDDASEGDSIADYYSSQAEELENDRNEIDAERDSYHMMIQYLRDNCIDTLGYVDATTQETIDSYQEIINKLDEERRSLEQQINALNTTTNCIQGANYAAAVARDPHFDLKTHAVTNSRIASYEYTSSSDSSYAQNSGVASSYAAASGAYSSTNSASDTIYGQSRGDMTAFHDFDSFKFYDEDGNLIEDVTPLEVALYMNDTPWDDRFKSLVVSNWYQECLNDLNYLEKEELEVARWMLNTGQYGNYDDYMQYMDSYIANRKAMEQMERDYAPIAVINSRVDEVPDFSNMTYWEQVAYANYCSSGAYYSEADALRDTSVYLAAIGFVDGIETFFTGLDNLFGADGEVSIEQMATSLLMQRLASDYEGEGNLAYIITSASYEVFSSIGNMAPSMLVGSIPGCQWLGTTLMGLSACGNAIDQALQEGLSFRDAVVYGVMTGASEALLEALLGGIPGLSHLNKWADLNGLAGYMASLISEGGEEAIQSILEPFFKSAATGGAEEVVIDWAEVKKSGIYGMLTAGLLNGVKLTQTNEIYARIKSDDGVTYLVGKEQRSQLKNDYKGKNLNDPAVNAQYTADLERLAYMSMKENDNGTTTVRRGSEERVVDTAKLKEILKDHSVLNKVEDNEHTLLDDIAEESSVTVNRNDEGRVNGVEIGNSRYSMTPEMESVFLETYQGGHLNDLSGLQTYLHENAPLTVTANENKTMTFEFSEDTVSAIEKLKEDTKSESKSETDSKTDDGKSEVKTENSTNNTSRYVVSGVVGNNLLSIFSSSDIKTLGALRSALITSVDLAAMHTNLGNNGISYVRVNNLSEYVEQGLANGSLTERQVDRVGSVDAHRGNIGDTITITSVDENGNTIRQEIEITADENGNAPWIITHLNDDGTIATFKDENGKTMKEMEVISDSDFKSQYQSDPVRRNRYVTNEPVSTDTLIEVRDNIIISGTGIALAAGSFINNTDSSNPQGMTRHQYENRYRQKERPYNGKHVLVPGETLSGFSMGSTFMANTKLDGSLIDKIKTMLNGSFLKIAESTVSNKTVDEIISELFDIDGVIEGEDIVSLRIIQRYETYTVEQLGIIISSRLSSSTQKMAAALAMYMRDNKISFKDMAINEVHNALVDKLSDSNLDDSEKIKLGVLLSSIYDAYNIESDIEIDKLLNGGYNFEHLNIESFNDKLKPLDFSSVNMKQPAFANSGNGSSLKTKLLNEINTINFNSGDRFYGIKLFLNSFVTGNYTDLMKYRNVANILRSSSTQDIKNAIVEIIKGLNMEQLKMLFSNFNGQFIQRLLDIGIFNNLSRWQLNYLYSIRNSKLSSTPQQTRIQQQIRSQQQNNSTQRNGSFVAVSDFHSFEYPLQKIKEHYMKEYDVVYILGDATDRGVDRHGTGGIQLLIDIMNLSKQNPGKVVYIPGNHDGFIVGYAKGDRDSKTSLLINGGEKTINDLNRLAASDLNTYNELISWLGSQPIQGIHQFNGKNYVFGHAQFNQKLYDLNSEYSLDDYFNDTNSTHQMAERVLWFRKADPTLGYYNPNEMPTADKIMVIGHTPPRSRRVSNLNLKDQNGNEITVHCVDGGISQLNKDGTLRNGAMLKYDGKEYVLHTEIYDHKNTSNGRQLSPNVSNNNLSNRPISSSELNSVKQKLLEGIRIIDSRNGQNVGLEILRQIILYKAGRNSTFSYDYITRTNNFREYVRNLDYNVLVAAYNQIINEYRFNNVKIKSNTGRTGYYANASNQSNVSELNLYQEDMDLSRFNDINGLNDEQVMSLLRELVTLKEENTSNSINIAYREFVNKLSLSQFVLAMNLGLIDFDGSYINDITIGLGDGRSTSVLELLNILLSDTECNKFLEAYNNGNQYSTEFTNEELLHSFRLLRIELGQYKLNLTTNVQRAIFDLLSYPGYEITLSTYDGSQVLIACDQHAVADAMEYGTDEFREVLINHVRRVFTGISRAEAIKFLRSLDCDKGICNYADVANSIFERFIGKEELFEEKFGFPMYRDGKFNDAQLLLDMFLSLSGKRAFDKNLLKMIFSKGHSKYYFKDTAYYLHLGFELGSTEIYNVEYIDAYLKTKGLDFTVSQNQIFNSFLVDDVNVEDVQEILRSVHDALQSGMHLSISSMPGLRMMPSYGDVRLLNEPHVMTIYGIDESGNLLIKSWGQDFKINLADAIYSGVKFSIDGLSLDSDNVLVNDNVSLTTTVSSGVRANARNEQSPVGIDSTSDSSSIEAKIKEFREEFGRFFSEYGWSIEYLNSDLINEKISDIEMYQELFTNMSEDEFMNLILDENNSSILPYLLSLKTDVEFYAKLLNSAKDTNTNVIGKILLFLDSKQLDDVMSRLGESLFVDIIMKVENDNILHNVFNSMSNEQIIKILNDCAFNNVDKLNDLVNKYVSDIRLIEIFKSNKLEYATSIMIIKLLSFEKVNLLIKENAIKSFSNIVISLGNGKELSVSQMYEMLNDSKVISKLFKGIRKNKDLVDGYKNEELIRGIAKFMQETRRLGYEVKFSNNILNILFKELKFASNLTEVESKINIFIKSYFRNFSDFSIKVHDDIYDSSNVGVNQGSIYSTMRSFDSTMKQALIEQVKVKFPGISNKMANRFLRSIENLKLFGGTDGICNYADIANAIFELFNGDEQLFEKIFSFPMYQNGKLNDTQLLLDMFLEITGDKLIEKQSDGTYKLTKEEYLNLCTSIGNREGYMLNLINKYLEKRGISGKFSQNQLFNYKDKKSKINSIDVMELLSSINSALQRGEHLSLSSSFGLIMTNSLGFPMILDGPHIMTIYGIDKNGNLLVDSWGKSYKINLKQAMKVKNTTIDSLSFVDNSGDITTLQKDLGTDVIDTNGTDLEYYDDTMLYDNDSKPSSSGYGYTVNIREQIRRTLSNILVRQFERSVNRTNNISKIDKLLSNISFNILTESDMNRLVDILVKKGYIISFKTPEVLINNYKLIEHSLATCEGYQINGILSEIDFSKLNDDQIDKLVNILIKREYSISISTPEVLKNDYRFLAICEEYQIDVILSEIDFSKLNNEQIDKLVDILIERNYIIRSYIVPEVLRNNYKLIEHSLATCEGYQIDVILSKIDFSKLNDEQIDKLVNILIKREYSISISTPEALRNDYKLIEHSLATCEEYQIDVILSEIDFSKLNNEQIDKLVDILIERNYIISYSTSEVLRNNYKLIEHRLQICKYQFINNNLLAIDFSKLNDEQIDKLVDILIERNYSISSYSTPEALRNNYKLIEHSLATCEGYQIDSMLFEIDFDKLTHEQIDKLVDILIERNFSISFDTPYALKTKFRLIVKSVDYCIFNDLKYVLREIDFRILTEEQKKLIVDILIRRNYVLDNFSVSFLKGNVDLIINSINNSSVSNIINILSNCDVINLSKGEIDRVLDVLSSKLEVDNQRLKQFYNMFCCFESYKFSYLGDENILNILKLSDNDYNKIMMLFSNSMLNKSNLEDIYNSLVQNAFVKENQQTIMACFAAINNAITIGNIDMLRKNIDLLYSMYDISLGTSLVVNGNNVSNVSNVNYINKIKELAKNSIIKEYIQNNGYTVDYFVTNFKDILYELCIDRKNEGKYFNIIKNIVDLSNQGLKEEFNYEILFKAINDVSGKDVDNIKGLIHELCIRLDNEKIKLILENDLVREYLRIKGYTVDYFSNNIENILFELCSKERYFNIIKIASDKGIRNMRELYSYVRRDTYYGDVSLSSRPEKNSLVSVFLNFESVEKIISLITSCDSSLFNAEQLSFISNKDILLECIKFRKDPKNYQENSSIVTTKILKSKYLKLFNEILTIMYDNDRLSYLLLYHSVDMETYIPQNYGKIAFQILQKIDLDVFVDNVLNDDLNYKRLNEVLEKYGFLRWENIFDFLIEETGISYDSTTIAILLSYFDRIEDKIKLEKVTLFDYLAIAGYFTNIGIGSKILFGDENYELLYTNPLPYPGKFSGNEKVKEALKFIPYMYQREYITVPSINENITTNDGSKSIKVVLGDVSNMDNLTYGERTGACMRIGGNAYGLFDLAIMDNNGFHIRFENPETGELISRITGFRNGNTLCFNQLRESLSSLYTNAELREITVKIAEMIIEKTKDSQYPIENVVINAGYGMFGSTLPSNYTNENVMNEFLSYFGTDFAWLDVGVHPSIVLATTATDSNYVPERFGAKNAELYPVLRKDVITYDNATEELNNKINHINVVEQLMIGNKIYNANIVVDGEIVFATIGQDWYMCIDKEGKFNIHILSNLSQSKYNTIVSEIRSNLDGILGKVDNKEEVLKLINEEFRRLGINEDISVDSDNTSSPSSPSNDSDEVSQIDSMEDTDEWVLDEDFGIEEEDALLEGES